MVERYDDHLVIRLVAAPGAAATTFGRVVLASRRARWSPRLHRHEYEHVRQYRELGVVPFLVRYLAEYVRWRCRRHGHRGAYRHLRAEVQAEWRARRYLGIGVVDVATDTVTPPR